MTDTTIFIFCVRKTLKLVWDQAILQYSKCFATHKKMPQPEIDKCWAINLDALIQAHKFRLVKQEQKNPGTKNENRESEETTKWPS